MAGSLDSALSGIGNKIFNRPKSNSMGMMPNMAPPSGNIPSFGPNPASMGRLYGPQDNADKRAMLRRAKIRQLRKQGQSVRDSGRDELRRAYADRGMASSSAMLENADRFDATAKDDYNNSLIRMMDSELEQANRNKEMKLREREADREDERMRIQEKDSAFNRDLAAQEMGLKEDTLSEQKRQNQEATALTREQMKLNLALSNRKIDLQSWIARNDMLFKSASLDLDKQKLAQAGEEFRQNHELKASQLMAQAIHNAKSLDLQSERNLLDRERLAADIRHRGDSMSLKMAELEQRGALGREKLEQGRQYNNVMKDYYDKTAATNQFTAETTKARNEADAALERARLRFDMAKNRNEEARAERDYQDLKKETAALKRANKWKMFGNVVGGGLGFAARRFLI
jgi:hypothetical protein